MKIFLPLILPFLLLAKEHMVQVEPFETYHIKSSVAASVTEAKTALEGKNVKNALAVKMDDKSDKIRLKSLIKKRKALLKTLKIEQENLTNLRRLKEIKKRNYERIKNLSTKSQYEKEQRLSDYLNANSLYLNQMSKIENLKIQLADIESSIGVLKDTIAKKSIYLSGYVYKIYPKKGDFVAMGAPLADVADTSRAKVTLYLDREELKNIDKKSIYIDGKRSDVEIYIKKIIPDKVHITQYEVQMIIPKPKIFGNLVKVEIK